MKANSVPSMKKLLISVITKYVGSFLFMGCILFLPAGSFSYWNAWLLIGTLFIPMLFVLVYLVTKDPELLQKRMQMKEKEKEQKTVQKVFGIFLLLEFLVPGFDYRFQWSFVPVWLVAVSAFMVLLGYILFFVVMKQNSYASRVVEIQDKQKIIDSGLYGIVRHPMYSSMLLIYLFSPLVLGSYYALIPAIAVPVMLSFRIKNEEDVLRNGLEGYTNYTNKVRYRLVPYFW